MFKDQRMTFLNETSIEEFLDILEQYHQFDAASVSSTQTPGIDPHQHPADEPEPEDGRDTAEHTIGFQNGETSAVSSNPHAGPSSRQVDFLVSLFNDATDIDASPSATPNNISMPVYQADPGDTVNPPYAPLLSSGLSESFQPSDSRTLGREFMSTFPTALGPPVVEDHFDSVHLPFERFTEISDEHAVRGDSIDINNDLSSLPLTSSTEFASREAKTDVKKRFS